MTKTFMRFSISTMCLLFANFVFAQVGTPQPPPDEALDAGFHAFYSVKPKPVKDRTNAAVGLAGITAPKGVDIFAFGRAEIDQSKKDWDRETNNAINVAFGKSPSAPVVKKEAAGKLSFVGSDAELACLQALSSVTAIGLPNDCASTKQVQALWAKNSELVARYLAISQLPHFQGDFGKGQDLLILNRLVAADIYLEVERGNTEAAYRKWKSNHQLMRLLKGAEGGWVAKAIFLVAESTSLRSFEFILRMDPRIAVKHADELLQLLKPTGIAYWNVPAILRAEYALREPLVTAWGSIDQPTNFLRNGFFRSAQAMVAASQTHPSLVGERIQKVQATYAYLGKAPMTNADLADPAQRAKRHQFMRAGYIAPQLEGAKDLVLAFHRIEERTRALSLAVMIAQKNVPDRHVAGFLAAAGPACRNAFTDKPFEWVEDQRIIRFVDPKAQSSFDVHL